MKKSQNLLAQHVLCRVVKLYLCIYTYMGAFNYTRLVRSHILITFCLSHLSLQMCVLPLHLVKPELTPLPCGRRIFLRYLGVSMIFPF